MLFYICRLCPQICKIIISPRLIPGDTKCLLSRQIDSLLSEADHVPIEKWFTVLQHAQSSLFGRTETIIFIRGSWIKAYLRPYKTVPISFRINLKNLRNLVVSKQK
jgi:hypothetical protein